jgi:transposase
MAAVAGVDWASDKHDTMVQDADGRVLWEGIVAHDEAGIARLCARLCALGVARVAIERPDGLLVERLLDAGLVVLALHPNQVKAARPRFSVAGGKSDRFDAMVLCELARTDHHRFRALTPDSDATKALRALTRGRGQLLDARRALCNQLRAELERCWPGATAAFKDLHRPIALSFLTRWPTGHDARRLTERQLAAFLTGQHYSGRRTPGKLLALLRQAPTGRGGEAETAARRHVVLALRTALQTIVTRIAALEREIADAIRTHPDGHVFLAPFRDPNSTLTAAILLAEIGDQRARYPTHEALAADAGMSAVAVESGKRKVATFRHACDHRLRNALCTLADATRHHNPWAKRLYRDARARGHNHQRAIRTLGRAWCRVLWRSWQDRIPYNPERHRALQTQLAVRDNTATQVATLPADLTPHPIAGTLAAPA